MFHKKSSENSSIRAGKDSFDMQNLNSKTNQELLDEIDMIISSSSNHDMDTDKIEQYLAALQDKAPVMEDYSVKSELNRIKDDHPLLFEADAAPYKNSKKNRNRQFHYNGRRPARLFLTVQICVAVMLCLVITANAFSINPVKELLKWAQGVIQLSNNPSGVMELPANDPSEYHSLKDALKAFDIESDKCPNWIPHDYALTAVEARDSGDIIQCTAIYEAPRGELLIRVIKYSNNTDWATTEEREDGGYSYTENGQEYYIISNYTQSKTIWHSDQCTYTISGQISENELKEMIKSINRGA